MDDAARGRRERILQGVVLALLAGTAGATPDAFDPEAPFHGLRWVNSSGDGRGVYLQLATHDALLEVPGHTGAFRLPELTAALLVSCRIPGPTNAVGPDPGYTAGVLLTPDHPQQPNAWRWFDPRAWAAHALGVAITRWPVKVHLPGGHVEDGTLTRRREAYLQLRPKLEVDFAPQALIRWLAAQTGAERFTVEVRGDAVAMRLAFTRWAGQGEAYARMTHLCPGVREREAAPE